MFANYLKIAFRNILRNKTYSFINIVGLAVGMAACVLIIAHVRGDLLWDGFHEKSDQTYRVLRHYTNDPSIPDGSPFCYPAVVPAMKADFADVKYASRYFGFSVDVTVDSEKYNVPYSFHVDPDFLKMFSFPLSHGDANTALDSPDGVVISQTVSKRFFGEDNPIGKTLIVEGEEKIVTGILAELPAETHLKHEILLPFVDLTKGNEANYNSWGWYNFYSYVQLVDGVSKEDMEAQFHDVFQKYLNDENQFFTLQPLADIHLKSGSLRHDFLNYGSGNLATVYSLLGIAIVILLIATINFMNLATARSTTRAREVGLRKTIGARRGDLVFQFIGESVVLSLIAMVFASFIVELAEPAFENLSGRPVSVDIFDFGFFTFGTLGLSLFVGILSGLYPAFVLSRFQPVTVMKSSFHSTGKASWLRRGLVVLQYSISILLIISTIIIYQQLNYFQSKDLGFERADVLVVRIPAGYKKNEAEYNLRLAQIPGIETVSSTSGAPGTLMGTFGGMPEGSDEEWAPDFYCVDENTLETFGFEMAKGRFFSSDFPSDVFSKEHASVVLNEKACLSLGWDDPIGKTIDFGDTKAIVIGVVKDFHSMSLHHEIGPLVLFNYQNYKSRICMRFTTNDLQGFIKTFEAEWSEMFPDNLLSRSFFNETLEYTYQEEVRQANVLSVFSGIAIIIASLGLLGLAIFATNRRKKELCIRKILGASTRSLLGLVTKEFVLLVLVANLIAWPIGYYLMTNWLNVFAYRMSIEWWIFPFAGLVALFIALFSVGFQAWRATLDNPTDNLRQN
jgi:putative ABC transport system permease protein